MYISLSDRSGGKRGKSPSEQTALSKVPFRLSPLIVWLGIVSMVTDISSESVTAILPLYVTGFLGLSTIAFGFIDGINQARAPSSGSPQAGRQTAAAIPNGSPWPVTDCPCWQGSDSFSPGASGP